jgi:hypothetical protein
MKLAFSTLGCPDRDLNHSAAAALRFGYSGIEPRALRRELDLLSLPDFIAAARESLRQAASPPPASPPDLILLEQEK